MRFSPRRAPLATSATHGTHATYAALVGGRVLWVALPQPAPVTLGLPGQPAIEVPTTTDDSQAGHHGVRLDLSHLPAQDATYEVRTGKGRPLTGPPVRAAAPGAGIRLTTDEDDHLHVVRRVVAAGPTLRAARLLGDAVELVLDVPGGGNGTELELVGAGAPITVSLVDGLVTVTAHDLAPRPGSTGGERTLRVLLDGSPVGRRANDLADPGAGAILPAVHATDEPTPRGRFRWSEDGLLVLRLNEAGGS